MIPIAIGRMWYLFEDPIAIGLKIWKFEDGFLDVLMC
jgi:hypothetical protein